MGSRFPINGRGGMESSSSLLLPPSVVKVSPSASAQNQVPAFDLLTHRWQADVGPLSPRGDRAITVFNQVVDPRATVSANFAGAASGAGTVDQTPTPVADGYQQQATPKSAQQIKATPDGAGGHYVGFDTRWKANGHPVSVSLGTPMVAVRRAAKITGTLGSSWFAALVVRYYDASDVLLQEVQVWTGVPALNAWFVAEGFDAQAPATVSYVESSLRVYGSTASNQVTISCTEFVAALDPDGDALIGYVGGDVTVGGTWNGTADASTSQVVFDPTVSYPAKDFGLGTQVYSQRATEQQNRALLRELGCNTVRMGVGYLTGGSAPSTPPLADPNAMAGIVDYVRQGLRIVLAVGNPPSWMCSNGATDGRTVPDLFLSVYASAHVGYIQQIEAATGVPASTWLAGVEVWNEPNLVQFNAWIASLTDNQVVDKYTAQLNAVYSAVKAAYPAAKILGGVLSCGFTGDTAASMIDPVTFYNRMFSQSAQFDYLCLHPYPGGPTSGPAATGWTPLNNALTTGFDRALGNMRDAQRVNSDTRSVYVTESGLPSILPSSIYPAGFVQPGERAQAQTVCMLLGRMLRDPSIAGVCMFTALVKIPAVGTGDYGFLDSSTLRRRPVAHQVAKMRGQPPQPPSYAEVLRIRGTQEGSGAAAPGPVSANTNLVNQVTLGIGGSASILLGSSIGNPSFAPGVSITRGVVGSSSLIALNQSADVTGTIRSTAVGTLATAGIGVETLYNPGISRGVVQAYDRGSSVFAPLTVQGSDLALGAQTGSVLIQNTAPGSVTLMVRMALAQTQDSLQIQGVGGGVVAHFDNAGVLTVPGFAASVTDTLLPWMFSLNPVLWPTDAALKTGTWTIGANSSQHTYSYIFNSSNAQNDEIGTDITLSAGTYTFSFDYVKNATQAIATVNLDGVSVGTFDQYAASVAWGQTVAISGVTVATTGKHRLSFKAATRNASASGWTLIIAMIQVRRTA